jgi:hypothetical protein
MAKKLVKSEEAILHTVLKKEVPITFLGEDLILKPLLFKDELLITSLQADLHSQLAEVGVATNFASNALSFLRMQCILRYCLYKKNGDHRFETLEEVAEVMNTADAITAGAQMFSTYRESFELTKAEKKS